MAELKTRVVRKMAEQNVAGLDAASILNDLLKNQVWSKTALLGVYKGRVKRLKELLDKSVHFQQMQLNSHKHNRRLVHVLLYHKDAEPVVWERLLRSVEVIIHGRRVYTSYQDACEAVTNHACEAVLSVWVTEKSVKDLVVKGEVQPYKQLRPGCIESKHIERFMINKKLFHYVSGCLKKLLINFNSSLNHGLNYIQKGCRLKLVCFYFRISE